MNATAVKSKYARREAIAVASEIVKAIVPFTVSDRLIVAGSLRRRKEMVGDIEIVYVPKVRQVKDGLFDTRQESEVDIALDSLLKSGTLAKRLNAIGSVTWGEKNKLAVHAGSGIPVDFFATSEECWFNYLVCRTGGAESNTRIATEAQRKGWKWHAYGSGFTDEHGNWVHVHSEQDVFRLVDLPYLEPWQRS